MTSLDSAPRTHPLTRADWRAWLTDAGERAIAQAKRNGAWSRLDDVEDLVEPADLTAALASLSPVRTHWDAFPPSARRGILEWIIQA